MLRTILLTFVTLALAVGGGGASVWLALNAAHGVGSVTVGQWTTFPDAGTPDADPYSRARFAREGGLALGRAEGIVFVASEDSAGAPIRRQCRYRISGSVPAARFWTLYAADADARTPLPATGRRQPALHSRMLLHEEEGTFAITVGRDPAPGNWLTVSGSGPMRLVLSLFDTPVSTSGDVSDVEVPEIRRTACDD